MQTAVVNVGRWKPSGDLANDIQEIKRMMASMESDIYSKLPTPIKPVADGTYTVGSKLTPTGNNGTITVSNGVITAVQQAS